MTNALSFRYFPAPTWLPSGVNIEFDPAQANTTTQNQRALLIGQMLGTGTAAPNVPVMAYSQAQVDTLCGARSMLALMYAAYRAQDAFGEVWIGPLLDNPGGVVATGTMTLSGTATAAGALVVYVMGVPISTPVAVGDAAATVMNNMYIQFAQYTSQIAAFMGVSGGTATFSAVHLGLALNDIDLRLNYVGVQNGEVTPPGLTVAFGNPVAGSAAGTLTGGTLNPVLTTLLSNCGAWTFDFIANPYNDTASLAAVAAFLNDQAGRWSAEIGLYGHAFGAYRGTVGARGTFGNSRNDQHATILGFFDSPTPAWLEAADWCAAHAVLLKVNPAQGVTTQALRLAPPPTQNVDTPGERNTLLFDGISTFTVDPAGTCRIDRSVTTYQTNPAGAPDNSYRETNLLFQAMYAARYIVSQLTSQYIAAGKILVVNGTIIGPGSPACTPNMVMGSVMSFYRYLCGIFIVQNPEAFEANAYATNGAKGQILLYLPLDFTDQVINIAILAEFVQST